MLDAYVEKGRGVVADTLVRWGKLSVGDSIVVGSSFGKVKSMFDSNGKGIKHAGPSTPVRLIGLRSVPSAGEELLSVESEQRARVISDRRQRVIDVRKSKEADYISELQENNRVMQEKLAKGVCVGMCV